MKKKCANFTRCELDVMVHEVEERKDVLFGRLAVGLTAELKKNAWEEVTAKVNEVQLP